MEREHKYSLKIKWIGNTGKGTSNYHSYNRDYIVNAVNKPELTGSADKIFLGDNKKYNPEDLFVASLSVCHMLTYLHQCADSGVIVLDYQDEAEGVMIETKDGGGRFSKVTLFPLVKVSDKSMINKAMDLHNKAHKLCFITNSCNFPILHNPKCII